MKCLALPAFLGFLLLPLLPQSSAVDILLPKSPHDHRENLIIVETTVCTSSRSKCKSPRYRRVHLFYGGTNNPSEIYNGEEFWFDSLPKQEHFGYISFIKDFTHVHSCDPSPGNSNDKFPTIKLLRQRTKSSELDDKHRKFMIKALPAEKQVLLSVEYDGECSILQTNVILAKNFFGMSSLFYLITNAYSIIYDQLLGRVLPIYQIYDFLVKVSRNEGAVQLALVANVAISILLAFGAYRRVSVSYLLYLLFFWIFILPGRIQRLIGGVNSLYQRAPGVVRLIFLFGFTYWFWHYQYNRIQGKDICVPDE